MNWPKNDQEVEQELKKVREEYDGLKYQMKIVEAKIRAIQEFCSHPANKMHYDNDPRCPSSHCTLCGKYF